MVKELTSTQEDYLLEEAEERLLVERLREKEEARENSLKKEDDGDQPVSLIINRNERANSYEFGKASNRFKLYFEDAQDLKNKIAELKELGILNEVEE